MNLFLDAMNAAKNLNQNVNIMVGGGGNKEEKLRNQITVCTYPDQTKYIIQKSVKQVFHVYPFFDSQILTFPQNNVQKKYLQLKAILQIQVKGKVCKVDYNMMIPYGFPNKSPYVRIINRNAQFNVDPFYKSLRSPTDAKSFILNQKLNEIASWNSSKSLVSIIIQSQDLFRKRFPFTKPHEHNSGFKTQEGWGNSPWQQQQSGYNQQILNQMVNQGFNNQGFQGYNNQVFNQGFDNRGFPNSQGYNNQGYNQFNQPPIPFGGQNNVSNIIAGAQKSAGLAKQKLQLMKLEHTKTLQKIQNLEILSYSLKSESQFLQRQNMDMTEFLKKNEGNPKENLTALIKPADGLSQQILDLISSIKAREDTVVLLESKFTNQSISFDEFLKNLRKIEEQKFDEKALLSKCTSMKNY